MKHWTILLTFLLVILGLYACEDSEAPTAQATLPTETETVLQTQPTEDPILTARRDAAEQYMRNMANYLWRASEDIIYTRDASVVTEEDLEGYSEAKKIRIKAGRLYRGIPYSYAGCPAVNFMDYASEPDENGIHTVSGLGWKSLNGGSKTGRVGNDCSGAIALAWNSIGADILPSSTSRMVRNRGYLPVGQYQSDPDINTLTKDTCLENGGDVMFAAYAQLKKADAIVYRKDTFGHTQMIVSVEVVYKDDGRIDPNASTVTTIDQTSSYIMDEVYAYEPEFGEDVYRTFGIDKTYTFMDLFHEGYLPVTCKAFIDPSPVDEAYVFDTQPEHTIDTIFTGAFMSNRILSCVTVTVTDEAGSPVGSVTCYNPRQSGVNVFTFDLAQIPQELEYLLRGSLDLSALAPGSYRCTHVLRDAHGAEYTMRDFIFTK